jgi:23S rRNA pseudouridine1911/1915/1917 synthase
MTVKHHFNTTIPNHLAGYRLDKALAELFPDFSRARLQQWIHDGQILVNSLPWRGKDKVQGGEAVQIAVHLAEEIPWQPQRLPLELLYEDEDVLVVNKPAGVVVHPGAGNRENTLVNALLHHAPELAQLPRAGVIHRLDKDTSGVLVVTRRLSAHTYLTEQLQAHQFAREYQTIVTGVLVSGGTIEAPIGRHPTHRIKMAVVKGGRPAITHYRIIQRYRNYTHLRVQLETGRTHQIRVHFAHQHHPILGDPVYRGRLQIPPASHPEFIKTLQNFQRQALHAEKLGFLHPRTGEWMEWVAPLPEDMQNLLASLAQDRMDNG